MPSNNIQIWLRNNPRVLWIALLPPLSAATLGIAVAGVGLVQQAIIEQILGAALLVSAVAWSAAVWFGHRPARIAFHDGTVFFTLQEIEPLAVPLDEVECFLLASGITQLPGQPTRDVQTRNLVIRFVERAEEWAHRELPLELGKWCEGQFTLRGIYCEPLDVALVNRLNQLLYDAQQAGKQRRDDPQLKSSQAHTPTPNATAAP